MREEKGRRERRMPFDALSWAMSLKNRRAARELLERRKRLEWAEASAYAPWTLGWAPELLERILELYRGEDELFCVHGFDCRKGWDLMVWGSLLIAAAAVDDLAAAKLLLERGYETDEHELYRKISLSPTLSQIGRLQTNGTNPIFVNEVMILPEGKPEPCRYFRCYLDIAGPLSAAIFCGAERCAAFFLERLTKQESWKLTLSVRHALIQRWDHEDPVYDRLVEKAEKTLGGEIPDLLDPGDFQDRRDPRFRECLHRHAGELQNRSLICYLLSQAVRDSVSREALEGVDPMTVSGCLLELLNKENTLSQERRELLELLRPPVLDRNAVPPDLNEESLMAYLNSAEVAGEVGKEELSALSVCILNRLMSRGHEVNLLQPARWLSQPLLRSGKVQEVLRQEDPAMVRGYLEYLSQKEWEKYPLAKRMTNLMLSLLGIQIPEEENYVL